MRDIMGDAEAKDQLKRQSPASLRANILKITCRYIENDTSRSDDEKEEVPPPPPLVSRGRT